ncbi:MAG: aminoacyl-tRNA hydrolase, partial [Acidimicrobiales bacterium]
MVGLGNPGADYHGTRHNAGADVVALLADRHNGRLKLSKADRALADTVHLSTGKLLLAFPQTYMNESGASVASLARRADLTDDPERVVVVHDELDLPLGVLRVKRGGGLAGHNGLRSVKAHLHTDAFLRVRIGIGKPSGKNEGATHVLSRPGKAERTELEIMVQTAA